MDNLIENNVKLEQQSISSPEPLAVIKKEKIKGEVLELEPLTEVKIETLEPYDIWGDISTPVDVTVVRSSVYFANHIDSINIKQEVENVNFVKSEHLSDKCYVPTVKCEDKNEFLEVPCSSKEPEILKVHELEIDKKEQAVKNKYPCPICIKNFPTSKSRNKHFSEHFKKNGVSCSSCGTYCFTKKEFLNHYISHRPKNNNIRKNKDILLKKDKITPSIFKQVFSCNKSYQKHSEEKPHKCKICYKTFADLSKHICVHEKKPFTCQYCFKDFPHLYKLKRHEQSHEKKPQQDIKPFMCEICSNRYASKHSLNNHLKAHTGDRPFSCELCDKRFFRKKLLKDHVLLHAEKRPFECNICLKSFTLKSKLNTHMKIHSDDRPFKCDICSKAFVSNHRLNKHLFVHRDTKKFHCTYCPKQFMEKRALQAHILLHEGKKPFKCNICSKAYTWEHNLNHHMKIHNEGSFRCDVCKENFPRYHILKNHIRIHSNF